MVALQAARLSAVFSSSEMAEQRNQFVIDQAAALFAPHVNPGGMLDRLLKKQTTLSNKEQTNEK